METESELVAFEELYELQEKIGTGSFEAIHTCKRKIDGKIFATKRFQKWEDGHAFEYYMREIKIHQALEAARSDRGTHIDVAINAEHVVKAYDYKYSNDGLHAYIIMDHLQGCNFRQVKDHLSAHEMLLRLPLLLKQGCTALQFLRETRIVHNDIKPDNIMFSDPENTNLMLVDFGWSYQVEHDWTKKDLFGLAMVLCHALFSCNNIEFIRLYSYNALVIRACHLLLEMLHTNPDDRPNAEVVIAALTEIPDSADTNTSGTCILEILQDLKAQQTSHQNLCHAPRFPILQQYVYEHRISIDRFDRLDISPQWTILESTSKSLLFDTDTEITGWCNWYDESGNIMFHFNPRKNARSIVMNSHIGAWGAEEIVGLPPFKRLRVKVDVDDIGYHVSLSENAAA
jgi:tRNA A-37 threonylcarbamoyl transferase component Bud32